MNSAIGLVEGVTNYPEYGLEAVYIISRTLKADSLYVISINEIRNNMLNRQIFSFGCKSFDRETEKLVDELCRIIHMMNVMRDRFNQSNVHFWYEISKLNCGIKFKISVYSERKLFGVFNVKTTISEWDAFFDMNNNEDVEFCIREAEELLDKIVYPYKA